MSFTLILCWFLLLLLFCSTYTFHVYCLYAFYADLVLLEYGGYILFYVTYYQHQEMITAKIFRT